MGGDVTGGEAAGQAAGAILLTQEMLESAFAEAGAAGRGARALVQASRLVQNRLFCGRALPEQASVVRRYSDGINLLQFTLGTDRRLEIGFGLQGSRGTSMLIGTLVSHWDGIGLQGPHQIQIRGETRSLAEFLAVLAYYEDIQEERV